MAWFGKKKKKAKKRPPVLEPVGAPVAQVTPVSQQTDFQITPAPAIQPLPTSQPNVTPVVQPVAPAIQPIVEIAPVGVVADTNIEVETKNEPKEWAKKSSRDLDDIHKRLDRMMESKGKSLEERYAQRFGDKVPSSVSPEPKRKDYIKKRKPEEKKPTIKFKKPSELNLRPKAKPVTESKKKQQKNIKEESHKETKVGEKRNGLGQKVGSGLKAGGRRTKTAIGNAGSAIGRSAGAVKSGIGRGAGAVKSGIGRGASGFVGLFSRNKKGKQKTTKKSVDYTKMKLPELKAALKKKGLPTSGKKAELIKRLSN